MNNCLIIMPLLFRGGSEKQIRYVIEAIDSKKMPLTVIVEGSDQELFEEEQRYRQEHSNVSFVFLNTNAVDAKYSGIVKRYIEKVKSLGAMSRVIRKCIKNDKIDSVMITNLTGLVFVPLFKRYGCNVIYNERNPGVKVCGTWWKRYLLKQCSKLVCNSRFASEYMSGKLDRDVEVINNGIHPIVLSNDKKNQSDTFRIIVPARVSGVKNQKVVLKALGILKSEMKLKVIFAGVIEDEKYYNELKEMCTELELINEAEFIGFTKNIYEYYENSELLILPSYEEGTPNVILEAFMCRLKVLASNIPMNSDCMKDKRFLFEVDNAEQLAEKIRFVKNIKQSEMNRVIEDNYQYVNDNYSVEKMGEKYISLLYSEYLV